MIVVRAAGSRINGEGYATDGQITHVGGPRRSISTTSSCRWRSAPTPRSRDGDLIGDPTEGALIVLAAKGGIDLDGDREPLPPRRRGAVRLRLQVHGHLPPHDRRVRPRRHPRASSRAPPTSCWLGRAYVLGADGAVVTVDDDCRHAPRRERAHGREGRAGHGVARRDFDPATVRCRTPTCCRWSTDLTLLAMVGIVDPPRPEAKAAIAECHGAGIEVRMITGDHAVTAAAIAHELGIAGQALTGAEFAAMSDDELDRRARRHRRRRPGHAGGQGPPGRHPASARATSSP